MNLRNLAIGLLILSACAADGDSQGTATGGNKATGGNTSTGGNSNTGGNPSTGGNKATGGNTNTGTAAPPTGRPLSRTPAMAPAPTNVRPPRVD